MQKKGAIEFSITTIIIVIIGVIILAIAIPWLTGTLGKAGGLTDAAFDNALSQLKGEPTRDNPIVLSQENFILKSGEKAPLIVRYLGEGNSVSISFPEGSNFLSTGTLDAGIVPAGQIYDWRVIVTAPASGTNFGRIKVGDYSVPIVVEVE